MIRRPGASRRGLRLPPVTGDDGAPAFDNLGAELYLDAFDASTVTESGGFVTAWENLGTAAAALDMTTLSGSITYASGSHLQVPLGSLMRSAGTASMLSIPDGESIDLVGVISSTAVNARRLLMGGVGGAHWRLEPRWGSASRAVIVDDAVGTLVPSGAVLVADGSIYSMRVRMTGATTPSLDSAQVRINDALGTAVTGDRGAVTFATTLELFTATGTGFDGRVYLLAAKVGGFSAGELATLTTRVNAAAGLSLTSV